MKKQKEKSKNPVRKGLWQIGTIFASIVGITLALLSLVALFEALDIHVPGSREMWIGLIGALLGGAFTLLGVQMTLNHQAKSDSEKRRLENMPILKFDVNAIPLEDFHGDGIYTLVGREIYTTGFPHDSTKTYPIITVSLANDRPAFDVCIESCITTEHTEEVIHGPTYFPAKYCLVANETVQYMFWIQDYGRYSTSNVLGLLRIAYSDVFGDQYYQDVPFSYDEIVFQKEHMMEISGIKAPLLAKDAPALLELIKEEYPEHHR